jgi:hypothetical protein
MGPIAKGYGKWYRPKEAYLAIRVGNGLSAGAFLDASGVAAKDSIVPEFVDSFGDPLPLLYLRANVGVAGVINLNGLTKSPPAGYQYDLSDILPYTSTLIGQQTHGIKELGDMTETLDVGGGINKAMAYFRHPSLSLDPNPAKQNAYLANNVGVPRMQSKFIIISAGIDRIYGTADDDTNFGSINKNE